MEDKKRFYFSQSGLKLMFFFRFSYKNAFYLHSHKYWKKALPWNHVLWWNIQISIHSALRYVKPSHENLSTEQDKYYVRFVQKEIYDIYKCMWKDGVRYACQRRNILSFDEWKTLSASDALKKTVALSLGSIPEYSCHYVLFMTRNIPSKHLNFEWQKRFFTRNFRSSFELMFMVM